ncbi:YdeI/OmpD-associated family protein [Spongiactinospora sp. TRM90649]|uniref:YdeI/OmpD-associated family protein n=1 Tax=Spongiactinospora sp. TRM90649 TaxID=3031114 RepID=UPI0023F86F14|nr:YdeI/OmpD-associated family protein [Spongiactinospora sp. TRM90649]MDF5757468.1 YdeI/OmpD-associated family protein [Spongiactinospora sp. TRM90649]
MNLVHAGTPAEWRAWLAANHAAGQEAWLVIHHRDSSTPGMGYAEAIEHALCYGWIDSHARKHDEHSSRLRFTPRDPRGTWSAVNRRRAARMTELGLMTEAGRAMVELAKRRGTWEVVPDAESLAVPADLRERLGADEAARVNFDGFPPSSRRLILTWIASAKRPETRLRRIERTVALAARDIRAAHPGVRMGDAP